MSRATPLEAFQPPERGAAVALGFFDGIHLGHQRILEGALEQAQAQGLAPVVFTFTNHPATWLRPEAAPPLLTSLDERVELLSRRGLQVVTGDFDEVMAGTPAGRFVDEVLVERLGARAVSVGPNHRYGRGGEGDPEGLREAGGARGFEVRVAEPVCLEGEMLSSSRIRAWLEGGEAALASRGLGRPYRLCGEVLRGAARGRGLGSPTANLLIPPGKVAPAFGVYAVWAGVGGALAAGVAHYGIRPTFGGGDPVLEVHLFEPQPDLYGQSLEVFLVARLRPEIRFPSPEALQARIRQDVAEARARLAREAPPPSLGA